MKHSTRVSKRVCVGKRLLAAAAYTHGKHNTTPDDQLQLAPVECKLLHDL